MKRTIILFVVTIVLCSLCLCSCSKQETLRCYVPDGAPALAVANIIHSGKVGAYSVETAVTTGEDVIAKCQSGEADLAILPTNAAITVCSARSEYCFFSVNIQGLLYVVGTQQISSLAELAGEKLHSIGLGNTPEYVFKKILDANEVDYATADGVDIQYIADGTTAIQMILQGKTKFALLGEPAVTNLINKAASLNKQVYRLFDLQQLWQQATQSQNVGYPQAGLIVKRSLLAKADFVSALTNAVFGNKNFLLENCATLNDLMKQAGSSLDVSYTAEILERCNLQATLACDAKNDIETYLSTFSAMSKFLPLNSKLFYEKSN